MPPTSITVRAHLSDKSRHVRAAIDELPIGKQPDASFDLNRVAVQVVCFAADEAGEMAVDPGCEGERDHLGIGDGDRHAGRLLRDQLGQNRRAIAGRATSDVVGDIDQYGRLARFVEPRLPDRVGDRHVLLDEFRTLRPDRITQFGGKLLRQIGIVDRGDNSGHPGARHIAVAKSAGDRHRQHAWIALHFMGTRHQG